MSEKWPDDQIEVVRLRSRIAELENELAAYTQSDAGHHEARAALAVAGVTNFEETVTMVKELIDDRDQLRAQQSNRILGATLHECADACHNPCPNDMARDILRLTGQRDIFLAALHGVIADLDQHGQIEAESTTTLDIYSSFYLSAELDGLAIPSHARNEIEHSKLWSQYQPLVALPPQTQCADKNRLDWLEAQSNGDPWISRLSSYGPMRGYRLHNADGYHFPEAKGTAREAIDAAMGGVQALMACGHPQSAVVGGNEGTNYCGDCERSAKDA